MQPLITLVAPNILSKHWNSFSSGFGSDADMKIVNGKMLTGTIQTYFGGWALSHTKKSFPSNCATDDKLKMDFLVAGFFFSLIPVRPFPG